MSARSIVYAAALCALTACGGGGGSPSSAPAAPAVTEPVATSITFIGNSLTYVPAGGSPESGVFTGDWGVAASSKDKDYAHLVGAALKLPVHVGNYAPLERDPSAALPQLAITPQDIVVVQLGDNGMPAKYAALLASLKPAHILVCVSTWWNRADRDALIKAACEAAGGRFVYIGDLWATRQDDVGKYTDPGVDAHPHDWGMARIAERVVAAIGGRP